MIYWIGIFAQGFATVIIGLVAYIFLSSKKSLERALDEVKAEQKDQSRSMKSLATDSAEIKKSLVELNGEQKEWTRKLIKEEIQTQRKICERLEEISGVFSAPDL